MISRALLSNSCESRPVVCVWRQLSSQSFVEIRREDPKPVFPDIQAKQLKRGRGGRSSFNGQIVTVFGGNGFVGRYVINKLAKTGSQVVVPFRGDFYDAQRLKVCGDLGQILFSVSMSFGL